jgi:O-antigen ligase
VQAWFYGTIAAKYAMAAVLLAGGFWFKPAWWVLAAAAALFVAQQARRGLGRVPVVEALIAVPALKVAYDFAYMSGYFKGRMGPRAASSGGR